MYRLPIQNLVETRADLHYSVVVQRFTGLCCYSPFVLVLGITYCMCALDVIGDLFAATNIIIIRGAAGDPLPSGSPPLPLAEVDMCVPGKPQH